MYTIYVNDENEAFTKEALSLLQGEEMNVIHADLSHLNELRKLTKKEEPALPVIVKDGKLVGGYNDLVIALNVKGVPEEKLPPTPTEVEEKKEEKRPYNKKG